MDDKQAAVPTIPAGLSGLIDFNVEYQVLVCIPCRHAVQPGALGQHLTRQHGIRRDIRRQMEDYICRVKDYIGKPEWEYEHQSMRLPVDGLEPQAWLPVHWGLDCNKCTDRWFRTINEEAWKSHRRTKHGIKGGSEDVPQRIPMQSWFSNGRQRYWIVLSNQVGVNGVGLKQQRVKRRAGGVNTDEGEASIAVRGGPVEGVQRKQRRVASIGVYAPVRGDDLGGESRGDEGGGVTANGTRQRVGIGACKSQGDSVRRVRFAEQVEIVGLGGLKRQLDRWSNGCPVCYFVRPGRASTDRLHTISKCQQSVARRIQIYSQLIDSGIRRLQTRIDMGYCRLCGVPAEICQKWQWNERQEEWEEDKERRCQYEGVLISAIVAMMELGSSKGMEKGKGLDWESREWLGKRVWWAGVEARQVVFMTLAQMNDVV